MDYIVSKNFCKGKTKFSSVNAGPKIPMSIFPNDL